MPSRHFAVVVVVVSVAAVAAFVVVVPGGAPQERPNYCPGWLRFSFLEVAMTVVVAETVTWTVHATDSYHPPAAAASVVVVVVVIASRPIDIAVARWWQSYRYHCLSSPPPS